MCVIGYISNTGALAFIQRDIQLQTTKAWTFLFFFKFVFTVSQCSKNVSTSIACSRENRPAVPQLEVCKQSTYSQYQKRSDINSIWVSVLEVNKVRRVSP